MVKQVNKFSIVSTTIVNQISTYYFSNPMLERIHYLFSLKKTCITNDLLFDQWNDLTLFVGAYLYQIERLCFKMHCYIEKKKVLCCSCETQCVVINQIPPTLMWHVVQIVVDNPFVVVSTCVLN